MWMETSLNKIMESLVRFSEKLWEELAFEVCLASIFTSTNLRAGSYQTKTPREGWNHGESIQ